MRTLLIALITAAALGACARDADGDGFDEEADCDDTNADVHPGATERCNGIDDDCNDLVDDEEGTAIEGQITVYADADADGFGDPDAVTMRCEAGGGYVEDSTDCDDTTDAAHPGATEVCDDIDNDCDSLVDDQDPDLDTSTGSSWYADTDGDGFGDADAMVEACEQPTGHVADPTDCNDDEADINTAATEICDELDNDCDELIDDADDSVDLATGMDWFADTDEDGFGDPDSSVRTCAAPVGYIADNQDCVDTDGAIHPDAIEVCDTIDNDCNSLIDDADEGLDASTGTTFYLDSDGDLYGIEDTSVMTCELPSGYAGKYGDCDDADKTSYPGATDIPQDGIDQDCDGADAPYAVSDLSAGDLIITEFMQNPKEVDDLLGEWFEVYNNSGGQIDLDGLYVEDDGSDSFTVSGSLIVDADDYAVFGANSDTTKNGGVTLDYVYGRTMSLGNGSDEITLGESSKLTTIFDEIAWDDGATFPDGDGAASSLEDGLDATDNDDGDSWCLATTSYGDGDLGTPGAANPVCKGPPYTVGHDKPLGLKSVHASNHLLGSKIVLSKAGTLDKFGLISLGAGPNVKMALYDDASGGPGSLVAQTPGRALTGAKQEIDITDVKLSAGTYYIMAVYSSNANISYTSSTSETVYYRTHSYSSALPSSFGSASTFTGQEYSYYLVMY